MKIRELLEAGVEDYGDGWAFQIAGTDMVHIVDIDDQGNALVRVFASTLPEAEVIFEGRVNVTAHFEREEEG